MKQLLGGAMLIALLSNGCAYETGGEGESEVAGEENLGEISEALVNGTWLRTILPPATAVVAPSTGIVQSPGKTLCRSAPSGAAYALRAGWLNGNTCRYYASGSGWGTSQYELLVAGGKTWVPTKVSCRNQICQNPALNATKQIGTNGAAICAAKSGTTWYPGIWSSSRCYVANSSGTGYSAWIWSDDVAVLQTL